jgi:accessory gene regulator protein AgrB
MVMPNTFYTFDSNVLLLSGQRAKKEVYVLVRYTSIGLTVPNTSLAVTLSLAIFVIDFRVPWFTYLLVPEAAVAASIIIAVSFFLSCPAAGGLRPIPACPLLVQNLP